MIWEPIDYEVLALVFMHALAKHELDVVDAVWASRESPIEDLLLEYKLEMLNVR